MEDAKDVIVALLGADVGLAGLLLVVVGLVFTQAKSFPPERTDDVMLARYEKAGKLGLIPFALALADAALCVVWLVHRAACTFWMSVSCFFLLLTLTAVYGSVLILRYL